MKRNLGAMEERKAKIIFTKAGGNASKNAYNCKISLPKKWIDAMKVTPDRRAVKVTFDGVEISITRDGDQDE